MNLCKDCKHFRSTMDGWYLRLDCVRFAKIDVVTGDAYGEGIPCHQYRAEVSPIQDKCGPMGKHFEDKYGFSAKVYT